MTARTYGGLSAEDRRSERQQRLFDAAFELLASGGVKGLTIRKLAAAAGVSSRHVYESFTDLDDLRSQAFDRAASEVAANALDAVATADPDLASQLKALLGALISWSVEEPDKARLLLTDSFGDPVLTEHRQQMSETFAHGFALYVRTHLPESVSDRRIALTARMLVGATAETFTARIQGAFPYPDDELLTDMVGVFDSAIRSLAVTAD